MLHDMLTGKRLRKVLGTCLSLCLLAGCFVLFLAEQASGDANWDGGSAGWHDTWVTPDGETKTHWRNGPIFLSPERLETDYYDDHFNISEGTVVLNEDAECLSLWIEFTNALLSHTGGTLAVGDLRMSGGSRYSHSGGSLTVQDTFYLFSGTYAQTGSVSVGETLAFGEGGSSRYYLSGGTLDLGGLSVRDGVFEFAGGSIRAGSVGVWDGGDFVQLAGNLDVDGSFDQDGGTFELSGGNMSDLSTGVLEGLFQQTGGTHISDRFHMWDWGTGVKVEHSGGTYEVTETMNFAAGTYQLSGNAQLSTPILQIEGMGSTEGGKFGVFEQTGGTNTVGTLKTMWYGHYKLSGEGVLTVDNEYIGRSQIGKFTQLGGQHSISELLSIGLNPDSDGVFEARGGSLTMGKLGIGKYDGSRGRLVIGGSSSVSMTGTEAAVLGELTGAYGLLVLEKSWSVNNPIVVGKGGSGEIEFAEGVTLHTGAAVLGQEPGAFGSVLIGGGNTAWNVAGDLTLGCDQQQFGAGMTSTAGMDVLAGGRLNVDSALTVHPNASLSLGLDSDTPGATPVVNAATVGILSDAGGAVGELKGYAAITATTLTNGGLLKPSGSAVARPAGFALPATAPDKANIWLKGDYVQTSDGTMEVAVGVNNRIDFSVDGAPDSPPKRPVHVAITGKATLGGRLNVEFEDGFQPGHQNSLNILHYGTIDRGEAGEPLHTLDQISSPPLTEFNNQTLVPIYHENNLSLVVPQLVVLAWDAPVLHYFENYTDKWGKKHQFHKYSPDAPLPAARLTRNSQNLVRAAVEAIFADSGIEAIEVINGSASTENAEIVQFTPRTPERPGGGWANRVDRFNRDSSGLGVCVVERDQLVDDPPIELDDYEVRRLAELAAHEVGHMLGLRHVGPSSGVYDIMTDDPLDPVEGRLFRNTASRMTDLAFNVNHNPVYHLKRYIDGYSEQELSRGVYLPGDGQRDIVDMGDCWDDESDECEEAFFENFEAWMSFDRTDIELFSVNVFEEADFAIDVPDSSGAGLNIRTLAQYDRISLAELAVQRFFTEESNTVGLTASSSDGGEIDIVLATGDPALLENRMVRLTTGDLPAFLQMYSPNDPAGYVTLSSVVVSSTPVPDPTALAWDNQGGIGDYRWSTAANWDLDQLPDMGADATIANGDTVFLLSAGQEAKTVSIENGKLIVTDGGELTVTEGVSVAAGGTLTVDGMLSIESLSIEGTLISNSTRVAGDGAVHVGGDVVFSSTASLEIGLSDPDGGLPNNVISCDGDVFLNGDLTFLISGASMFKAGTYTLITAAGEAGIVGDFQSVSNLGAYAPGGGLTRETGRLTLTLDFDLNPGDADLSATTDLSDFNVWNANKFMSGTDWTAGDFNGDGVTDLSDFNIWNAHKFTIASGGAAPAPTEVPEPGTLGLLIVGVVMGLACRRLVWELGFGTTDERR